MKIGIVGTGSVGQALAKGFLRAKHEVRLGSRDPAKAHVPAGAKAGTRKDVAGWADVVILAVPFSAVKENVDAIGPDGLRGKALVDVTNVLAPSGDWAVGFSMSGAEQLARLAPAARVVKAFNAMFAEHMSTGNIGGETLALFVAGDDTTAKETVMRLGRDIGFDPVDAGPLRSARYLEPMGIQLITLGYGLKMGGGIGFRLVRRGT